MVFDKETVLFIKDQSKIEKNLLTVEGQRILAKACMLNALFVKQNNVLKKKKDLQMSLCKTSLISMRKIRLFEMG